MLVNVSELVMGTEEDKVGKINEWGVLKKEGRRIGLMCTRYKIK